MKIGIIREEKIPAERRVPFSPQQCQDLQRQYPNVKIFVQPSPHRCFEDVEYASCGISVQENLAECDILFGVKEVPLQKLMPNKRYFFFSHTIKKQPHNQKLLQEILKKNIHLIDYETLTDRDGNRIVAFGRYAGLVGAYNGILAYGKKHELFDLKPANLCYDLQEMKGKLSEIELPNIKIAVVGSGRVGKGAMEILDTMQIPKISVEQYLNETFDQTVYVNVHSKDYHEHLQKKAFDAQEFHQFPEYFRANFQNFYSKTDLLIATAFWNPKAPLMFSKEEMKKNDFKIKVIADITCDIDGSIPCTMRASTIQEPLYNYNPKTESLENFVSKNDQITVMAVDNLPCEIPRDASISFGKDLTERVIPALLNTDSEQIIYRASITQNGKLNPNYSYLEDYVKGIF
ncbi:MAG: alanine dehydrogenase [Bacteroidetes bacterium]|nr:MAG: alanine dehydrogenase [Bacteroidota bacterium]